MGDGWRSQLKAIGIKSGLRMAQYITPVLLEVDSAVGVRDVTLSILLPHEVIHVIAEKGMTQARS